MDNNKKNSLVSKWNNFKKKLLQIKEQNESVFLVHYEDLIKAMSDGYLINWVSIVSSDKLNNEIQRLITERVNKYKKNSMINVFSYDDNYYEDVIRGIIEQKNNILDILNSKPYDEATIYMKKIIEDITDEEINNYIKQGELKKNKILTKRLQ